MFLFKVETIEESFEVSQERLNGLATLYIIKKKLLDEINILM